MSEFRLIVTVVTAFLNWLILRYQLSPVTHASSFAELPVGRHGEQALQAFHHDFEVPQRIVAAILDLTVAGGMGGRETCEHLRLLRPDLPILVVSGSTGDPVLREPQAYRVDAVLRKPYLLTDRQQALSRVFQARQP
jgi:CheY-like chemotaxis protein